MRSGNKECPTCRKKLVSKRSLRPDPNFDALISKIYPSRDEYEAHQERMLAKLKQAMNPAALTQNIEEGLRQQALNRAQRIRKLNTELDSHPESECNTPAEGPSRKQVRLTPDESVGENSTGDQSLEGSSMGVASGPEPVTEIELVFKPHPDEVGPFSGNQPRFIKTTANATGRRWDCVFVGLVWCKISNLYGVFILLRVERHGPKFSFVFLIFHLLLISSFILIHS